MILQIINSIAIPTILGYSVVRSLFHPKALNFTAALAIAYGLGLGLTTFLMFVLSAAGIRLNLITIFAAQTVIIAIMLLLRRFRSRTDGNHNTAQTGQPSSERNDSLGILMLLTLVYIIYQTITVFWYSLHIPIYIWDEVFYIATKGKVIFYEQSIAPIKHFTWVWSSYPLLLQLAQVWVADNLCFWDDQWIKIIFPFAYLSYLVIQYHFVASLSNRKMAIFSLGLLVSSLFFKIHATINYSDFILMYYNCATVLFIILWCKNEHKEFLILASIFAAFAVITKTEGAAYFVLYTALVSAILYHKKEMPQHNKIKHLIFFSMPSLITLVSFSLYKWSLEIPIEQRTHISFSLSYWERIPQILKEFVYNLLLTGNWNILWFLLAISLANNRKKIKNSPEIRYLLLILCLFFTCWLFIGTFTNHFDFIGGAQNTIVLSRLILHFFPLCPILIVLLNTDKENPQ